MQKLTAARVKTLTKPGMHNDGDGLYLHVASTGAKSWAFRATIDGKRRELGLGPYPTVPLERDAFPELGDLPVDRIDRFAVLNVLTPIWTKTPETARRVRQRIRAVMHWAMAHGLIDDNRAGEVIAGALPAMPKVRAHLPALPYDEVAGALRLVAASRASTAVQACFRFLVLTAARCGQARGATWAEIDRKAREWRIPASRMKSNRAHRVPLSPSALQTLVAVEPLRDGSDLLFPSPLRPRNPLSDMALTKLLRDVGLAERTTVHGFRSAFRDWAAERTTAPHAVRHRPHARHHRVSARLPAQRRRTRTPPQALLARHGSTPPPIHPLSSLYRRLPPGEKAVVDQAVQEAIDESATDPLPYGLPNIGAAGLLQAIELGVDGDEEDSGVPGHGRPRVLRDARRRTGSHDQPVHGLLAWFR